MLDSRWPPNERDFDNLGSSPSPAPTRLADRAARRRSSWMVLAIRWAGLADGCVRGVSRRRFVEIRNGAIPFVMDDRRPFSSRPRGRHEAGERRAVASALAVEVVSALFATISAPCASSKRA